MLRGFDVGSFSWFLQEAGTQSPLFIVFFHKWLRTHIVNHYVSLSSEEITTFYLIAFSSVYLLSGISSRRFKKNVLHVTLSVIPSVDTGIFYNCPLLILKVSAPFQVFCFFTSLQQFRYPFICISFVILQMEKTEMTVYYLGERVFKLIL